MCQSATTANIMTSHTQNYLAHISVFEGRHHFKLSRSAPGPCKRSLNFIENKGTGSNIFKFGLKHENQSNSRDKRK